MDMAAVLQTHQRSSVLCENKTQLKWYAGSLRIHLKLTKRVSELLYLTMSQRDSSCCIKRIWLSRAWSNPGYELMVALHASTKENHEQPKYTSSRVRRVIGLGGVCAASFLFMFGSKASTR